jgi:hypothetical protein
LHQCLADTHATRGERRETVHSISGRLGPLDAWFTGWFGSRREEIIWR